MSTHVPLGLYGQAPPSVAHATFAATAKGFRHFFLLASGFATVILPLWLSVLFGEAPSRYLDPVTWHAHEMVFGFSVAVIAGFLLTAVANWTQRETLVAAPLLALVFVWVAGRVAMTVPLGLPPWLVAALDLAFLPLLIIAIARPIVVSKNWRNLIVLVPLTAMFAANLAIHLDVLGIAPPWRRRATLVGVDLIVFVIQIIAGRVIPMFTRSATKSESVRSTPLFDVLALVGMAAVCLVDALAIEGLPSFIVFVAAGAFAVARCARWGGLGSTAHPLLWVLHLGYAWIPIGLFLRAVSAMYGGVPGSLGTHALTVGAIGTLTLGMMARVALGHTGRVLEASRVVRLAFVSISGAALVRVFGPLAFPGATRGALVLAAVLWTAAFLMYLLVYVPILSRPRIDGKSG